MVTLLDQYESILLALCMWREARGQSRRAKIAVKHVILNRAANPRGPYHNCHTVTQNVLRGAYPSKASAQFSSFNRKDLNSSLLPDPGYRQDWRAWIECCSIVEEGTDDPTGGATHYYDRSIDPPYWATADNWSCQIGDFMFHKL